MSEPARPKAARRQTDRRVGLCVRCRHGVAQPNARGSVFWRCLRADGDPAYLRYPPLPVADCPGFEAGAEG